MDQEVRDLIGLIPWSQIPSCVRVAIGLIPVSGLQEMCAPSRVRTCAPYVELCSCRDRFETCDADSRKCVRIDVYPYVEEEAVSLSFSY